MLSDNPSTDIEKRRRFLKALSDINFSVNHVNFCKRVTVKTPRFIPKFLYRFFDKNFGKEGIVVFVEVDEIFQRLAYDVVFEVGPNSTYGHYFEEELEFNLPDMLTAEEKKILGLDKFKK